MSDSIPGIELRGVLWTLHATAPEFHAADSPIGRIHSLRTLAVDGRTEKRSDVIVVDKTKEVISLDWRLPRLLSVHLVAGSKVFTGDFAGTEKFRVDLGEFQFEREKGFVTTGDRDAEDGLMQQVVAEPLLDDQDRWPKPDPKSISAPPMRLVAGAIEIAAATDKVSWLGETLGAGKRIVLRLTPDGIELDAEVPFPGSGKLEGRFLLTRTTRGLRLRLLSRDLDKAQREAWQKAWTGITPRTVAEEEKVPGFKIEARRDEFPPAFEWPLQVDKNGIRKLNDEVEIPGTDLRVRLLSPKDSRKVIDGEVTVIPEFYRLAAFDPQKPNVGPPLKEIVESWGKGFLLRATIAGPTPATRLVLRTEGAAIEVKLEGRHLCAHDEIALARNLRAAQGIEDPLPGKNDRERPLLAAFVPLDDGWLQLPVPNCPPPDPSQDKELLASVAVTPPNVLSGFLRYAQRGSMPSVLSAFSPDTFEVPEAPWTVTVEGATGIDVLIGLELVDGKISPVNGAVSIDAPQLSTRGLVWISSDRPDALEALPRLGAGAGQYLDIPLETFDIEKQATVAFTITALAIDITVADKGDTLSRKSLGLSVDFENTESWRKIEGAATDALKKAHEALSGTAANPKPLPTVRWQRHPRMPFAAAMPMTRAAGSAVRPLESRDLVPWVVETEDLVKWEKEKENENGKAKGRTRLSRMEWTNTVFPRLLGAPDNKPKPSLRPPSAWPLPLNRVKQDEILKGVDRAQGIALVAFGVPGAELGFAKKGADANEVIDDTFSDDPWARLRYALRYDLPLLDEAFATATLPPTPPEDGIPEERELPPEPPLPVAHDWPAMRAFWAEQNRRHQLARVAHSYLAPYSSLGVAVEKVFDLIGGVTWSPANALSFVMANDTTDKLPYGHALIDGETLKGNDGLRGINQKKFGLKNGALESPPSMGSTVIEVIGNAPATFAENDFLFDSRRAGTKQARVTDKLLLREIRGGKATVLATLRAPIAIGAHFRFWFKDLPLANGEFTQGDDLDFNAWQDANLPESGFEWRLIPENDAPAVFERGRHLIPFFGLALEPLRLKSCKVAIDTGAVEKVGILARLHLGPRGNGPASDGNLVTLLIENGTITKLESESSLTFAFDANIDRGHRRITLSVEKTGWSMQKPAVTPEALTVEMFGSDQRFAGEKLLVHVPDAIDGRLGIGWTNANKATVSTGEGALVIRRIEVDVSTKDTGDAVLKMEREVLLTPRGAIGAIGAKKTGQHALKLDVKNDTAAVQLLDLPLGDGKFHELDGALAVVLTNSDVNGTLIRGFKVKGKASLGLAARLMHAVDGEMLFSAGYLDGEITCSVVDARIGIRRIALHAEQQRRVEPPAITEAQWIGAMRVDGRLTIDSAIGWPIATSSDVIPAPGKKEDGGTDVTLDPTRSRHDRVEYTLDGHALPFDVAAAIRAKDPNTAWVIPVVSRHTLKTVPGGETRTFTGVETIAIGVAAAIVPALGDKEEKDPKKSYAKDPVTWAARHAEAAKKGIVHGMVYAGVGRLATVLSGALGVSFRAAFKSASRESLFLAGGFAGLIGADDGKKATLVRLPVLAAIDDGGDFAKPGFIAQASSVPVRVAWPDGEAAREAIATMRSATAPASTSDTSLRSALLASSRAAAASGVKPEQTTAAILVEQTFATDSESPSEGNLKTTPFFIGAAVTLARALETKSESKTVLSLIAGSRTVDSKTVGLAGALVTRFPLESGEPASTDATRSELATVGDDLLVHPWNGPALADLGDVHPVGLVTGPAFQDHLLPRAVIVRSSSNGVTTYDAPRLPQRRRRPRPSILPSERTFDDIGRGYPLLPSAHIGWLAGPEEGPMQPYRDAASPTSSGLAGLSRPMTLPAHAVDVSAQDAARRGIVWLSQARAPIYLPLELKDVHSPAVPWLSPGFPRPRIPSDSVVKAAFEKVGLGAASDGLRTPQPIVPERVTVASVGDRAGISVARIARLETPLGATAAFDSRYSRFGRPGQGGSWSVRTERTPRPGPLPQNTGDEMRDRRPCASPLLPFTALSALKGPADTVRGEAGNAIGRWSVTFVAALEWEGMVTESWDGTIRLHAEIDVERNTASPKPASVVNTLFGLLFPLLTQDGQPSCKARASLVIGQTVVPFARIHVEESPTEFGKDPVFQKNAGDETFVVDRGLVKLVLDARPNDAGGFRGNAHGAIAGAFTGATLPPVEIQLIVHPDSRGPVAPPLAVLPLDQKAADVATGASRAPVTLRIPLAPVIRSRGALPLAPTSLLFTDPAYDAGLSTAPARAEGVNRVSATGFAARGALLLTLQADRGRINRRSSVTFMIDLAYEKKPEAKLAQGLADQGFDGDLADTSEAFFDLTLRVFPNKGLARDLYIGKPSPSPVAGFAPPAPPKIRLATVCELPMSTLVEGNGTAAALVAGDMLEFTLGAKTVKVTVAGKDPSEKLVIHKLHTADIVRTLRIVLTDEPVVDPPPALYAALVRRETSDAALSLPLYAQSPLPWRVDLRDPKRDFRRGVMRRTATFIWTLARPLIERQATRIHIVKADRNGQTFLPENVDDFLPSRAPGEMA
ncbi:MAG: hypothetical protein M3P06_03050 [Acidobacteriota bacterium]|nr:hypothetical protein [Acidobacteriota bacterium]